MQCGKRKDGLTMATRTRALIDGISPRHIPLNALIGCKTEVSVAIDRSWSAVQVGTAVTLIALPTFAEDDDVRLSSVET